MKHNGKKSEGISYWLSYSDMMAALILVLVLILTVFMFISKVEINEQKKKINEQQERIEKMIGVREEIIKALQERFKGSNLTINIDPNTGSIVFDSALLFDPDKYVLKDKSKEFLDVFLPQYFSVLLGGQYAENISEIIVEGHTDRRRDYFYNLDLSQKRAYAVAEYILRDGSNAVSLDSMENLRKILTANGRSFCDPIFQSDGVTVNEDASRRVEIKFRLKDDEMINQMREILNS